MRDSPERVYLFIQLATNFLFHLAFTAMALYEVQVVALNPLQLVLVGTTLEGAVALFEVPTGVVADVRSRRLSVLIGNFLIGAGLLLEGAWASFLPVLAAMVVCGLGFTFTSGALQAWLTDETGEEAANRAFLRGSRIGLLGALGGMLAAVLTGGATSVRVPILLSGGLFIVLTGILSFLMVERGFRPLPRRDANPLRHLARTAAGGFAVVRDRPALRAILGVGLFYGLYSEGFDRLWVKHLADGLGVPHLFGKNDLPFFGLLRAAGMVLSIFAVYLAERKVDTGSPRAIARALGAITAGIAAGIVLFALTGSLAVAAGLTLIIAALRQVAAPLQTAWVNKRLAPGVRATVLSMSSQVDAAGQIVGGPAVGWLGRAVSVRAAIAVSGLLLIPALPLIRRTERAGGGEGEPLPGVFPER